jgi:outer membrane protein OmpA-like peptidoglycan-associated protein
MPRPITIARIVAIVAIIGLAPRKTSAQNTAADEKPGTGAWANYDFVPGETVLFYEDFANDRVGDFPRRLTFVRGNWEIVEWQGRRLLRNTGPRHAAVQIPLPSPLPERFTIEIEAYFPHPNQQLIIATAPPQGAGNVAQIEGNFFQIAVMQGGTGVTSRSNTAVKSLNPTEIVSKELAPVRIMVDGTYAKVYVGEQRVANVPNAELRRGASLHLENTYFADETNAMLLGTIRIAAGGRDLYDELDEKGRVATQGILFATGSARIRPESTPTLHEIGAMLQEHPDLAISIEGHTDDVGDDASNQTLSEQRAAAVKAYLVDTFGIDAARLDTAGFGESKPAIPDTSPEARQQNRRVELVRTTSTR